MSHTDAQYRFEEISPEGGKGQKDKKDKMMERTVGLKGKKDGKDKKTERTKG